MSAPGAVELSLYWKPSSDLGRNPSLEVIAIPLEVDDEANALLARGGFIQLQVLNKYVNDSDLDQSTLGECAGYITVYPGYTSKKKEPPQGNIRTYFVNWASVYIMDEERSKFTITMFSPYHQLGDDDNYFWGRFG